MNGPMTSCCRALLAVALVGSLGGCQRGPSPDAPQAPAAHPTAVASVSAAGSALVAPGASSAVAAQPDAPPAVAASIPDHLNVLLITIDALRADMPWAGYPRAIAPNLSKLHQHSVAYTNAYALSSYTSMSVGGLLGGDYPSSMKRDGFFFGTYPKEDQMFPERLQAAGIRTIGAHAHRYFASSAGFNQGFDVWEMVPGIKFDPQTDTNITGPKHLAIALRLLGDPANTSRQFFAWFHFMDPHDVYMLHKEIDPWGTSGRDRYDGEVQFTDVQIGKLLSFVAEQPWASHTAIIVTSDHGEAFGEHGVYRHGFELIQELVRVPLFVAVPGVEPRRIGVARSQIDLAPTILELMGVEQGSKPLRGQSLVAEMLAREQPEARDVIIDLPRTSDNDRRRALISGRYKLVAYADDAYFRLFDLEADPHEQHDLRKESPAECSRMVQRYRELSRTIPEVKPYACHKLKGAPEEGQN